MLASILKSVDVTRKIVSPVIILKSVRFTCAELKFVQTLWAQLCAPVNFILFHFCHADLSFL
jgi:hypothetical protein